MTDIVERLTYGNVLAAPLLLQEAVDQIRFLRAELERERKWIRQLEGCVLDSIKKDYDRKI